MDTLTMKRCGHCGRMKPATAEFYHRDEKKSSGWQSWCKECVRSYRAGNGTALNGSAQIANADDEMVELYLMGYLEAYNNSTKKTYGGRIQEAREYAAQLCPQARQLIKAYGNAISGGKRLESRDEKLGLAIVVGIRKLNLKQSFKKGNRPTTNPNPSKPSSPAENLSIVQTYCNWIENNDFVPHDTLLAYFTGASRGAFVNSRRKLTETGYVLEQSNFGWNVTGRPAKEKTIDELSKDELIALVKKLVAEL